MSNSFYIRIPDATEIDTGYGGFANDVEEAIGNAAISIDALVSLDSLTGRGAEAIKAYFTQVHQTLLYLLLLLVKELDTVYNSPYYQGVLQAAKNDSAGEFPSWDMWDKARAFQTFADGDIPPIDSLMRSAVQAAPAGYTFHTPGTDAFRNAMGTKSRKLDTTRESFENAESAGVSALTSTDDNYQRLYRALSAAISQCANGAVSMASYKSGDFHSVTSGLGLQRLAADVQKEQDAKSDIVISTKLQGADNRAMDIERAEREAAEAKKAWALGGEALQAVVLGAAVVGLCVATGGVAIAFSAVAVAGAGYNLVQREKQRQAMKKNSRADIDSEDDFANGLKTTKGMKDYGKGLDTIRRNAKVKAKAEYYGLENVPDGAMRNIGRTGASVVVSAGTQVIGHYLDEEVGSNLEGDSKLAYKEGKKAVEKGVEEGSDALLKKAMPEMKLGKSFKGSSMLDKAGVSSGVQKTLGKGAGWVGFAAGCAQIYTDHQVEKYDQILDECESDKQDNTRYRQSIWNGSGYQWEVQW